MFSIDPRCTTEATRTTGNSTTFTFSAPAKVLVPDLETNMHHDTAVLGVLLVVGHRHAGANAGPAELSQHLGQQLGEDRPEVLVAETDRRPDCLSDPDWLGVLDDDVVNVH